MRVTSLAHSPLLSFGLSCTIHDSEGSQLTSDAPWGPSQLTVTVCRSSATPSIGKKGVIGKPALLYGALTKSESGVRPSRYLLDQECMSY